MKKRCPKCWDWIDLPDNGDRVLCPYCEENVSVKDDPVPFAERKIHGKSTFGNERKGGGLHLFTAFGMMAGFLIMRFSGLKSELAPFAAFASLIGALYFFVKYIAPWVDRVINGRMRRVRYFWFRVIFSLIGIPIFVMVSSVILHFALQSDDFGFEIAAVPATAMWGLCVFFLDVQRAHDIGWCSKIAIWSFLFAASPMIGFVDSGLGAILYFISGVPVFIIGVILLFAPGTNGANQFGERTDKSLPNPETKSDEIKA